VDGLLSYFEYNPGGVKDNSKTNGSPLNAVVITTWRGKWKRSRQMEPKAEPTITWNGARRRALFLCVHKLSHYVIKALIFKD